MQARQLQQVEAPSFASVSAGFSSVGAIDRHGQLAMWGWSGNDLAVRVVTAFTRRSLHCLVPDFIACIALAAYVMDWKLSLLWRAVAAQSARCCHAYMRFASNMRTRSVCRLIPGWTGCMVSITLARNWVTALQQTHGTSNWSATWLSRTQQAVAQIDTLSGTRVCGSGQHMSSHVACPTVVRCSTLQSRRDARAAAVAMPLPILCVTSFFRCQGLQWPHA